MPADLRTAGKPEESQSAVPERVLDRLAGNRSRYLKELMEFLGIPSVSQDPLYAPEVRKAADWALTRVERLGFSGKLFETPGFPIVYAERCPYKTGPTLLVYGHYDVQPPGPLQAWKTPPFAPTVRDGAVYARGAMDDKGQMLTYLDAIDAILAAEGSLPLNVKLIFEGEEEMGSQNFDRFVQERRDMLRADLIALSDSTKFSPGLPAIRYGYRGLINMQIEVTGPAFSVHSGMFGGFLRNPVTALARILCHLKDEDSGRITIPGFYYQVRDAEAWERQEVAALPFDSDALRRYLGVDSLAPEKGYSALESMCFRPTLDVGGIWGGYEGEGLKTIIPSRAGAKVSIRLVPDQKVDVIGPLVRDYLRSLALPGVQVKITRFYGNDPLLLPTDSQAMEAAKRAIEYGFGRRPALIRMGGTVGAVTALHRQLGIEDILMLGWGNPEDGAHAPDEHFYLEDFSRGAKTVAALLYGLRVPRA